MAGIIFIHENLAKFNIYKLHFEHMFIIFVLL